MKTNKITILAIAFTLFCGCVTDSDKYTFDQLDSMMTGEIYQCESQQVSMCYRFLIPENMNNPPIIFFLHGAAGNGYDNKLSIRDSGFGNLSYNAYNKFNSIIVAPQCPYGIQWRDEKMVDVLNEFVSYCTEKFHADPKRVYVTGYSMGGIGTWKLIQKYPEQFAAAVPVCGGPLSTEEHEDPVFTEDLRNLNIWAFNNLNDTVVQNNYSKTIISKLWDSIDSKETTKAHFTEGFNGHTDNYVYSNINFLIWLYSMKNSN